MQKRLTHSHRRTLEILARQKTDRVQQGVAIAILSALGFFVFLVSERARWEMLDWPSTPGRVVEEATVREFRRHKRTLWAVDLGYEYRVNGIRYWSGRVWDTGSDAGSEAAARTVASRYGRLGQSVIVTYDPQNPKHAFLVRDEFGVGAIILALAAAGVIGGIAYARGFRLTRS